MLDALRDDEARRAMGRHAQQRVRHDFSFARQARQFQELFAKLAGKKCEPCQPSLQ
jgi:glycosyltransferase involved in cell wall biosynthesis